MRLFDSLQKSFRGCGFHTNAQGHNRIEDRGISLRKKDNSNTSIGAKNEREVSVNLYYTRFDYYTRLHEIVYIELILAWNSLIRLE